MMQNNLARFLDENGVLVVWPSKHKDKLLVIEYLATKFEYNKIYSEAEVNNILKVWHNFSDWAILRRSLVDYGYMKRDFGGYEYKRVSLG